MWFVTIFIYRVLLYKQSFLLVVKDFLANCFSSLVKETFTLHHRLFSFFYLCILRERKGPVTESVYPFWIVCMTCEVMETVMELCNKISQPTVVQIISFFKNYSSFPPLPVTNLFRHRLRRKQRYFFLAWYKT